MGPLSSKLTVPRDLALDEVADRLLRNLPLDDAEHTREVWVWRLGALVVVFEIASGNVVPVAVVLDDRDGSIDALHPDAWRAWLSLSNALALRSWPTVVTTVGRRAEKRGLVGSGPVVVDDPAAAGLDDVWLGIFEQAVGNDEKRFIVDLGARGVPVPVLGHETEEGIPLDVSWPDRMIAVEVVAKTDQDRNDLVAAGWILVPADADDVAAVLSGGDAQHNPEVDG